MEELKSVRVRRRLATLDEKGGSLDVKVTAYKDGQKIILKGFNNNNIVWPESIYDTTKTTADLINDFIRVNTLKERKGDGETVKVFNNNTGKTEDLSYYHIVQDPWSDAVPVKRSYGFDPYYLNNGSVVYIKWLAESYDKMEYNITGMTVSSGLSSSTLMILVEVQTSNQKYPDFDLSFDFNGTGSEIDAGFSYVVAAVNSVVERSINVGFTNNGSTYPKEGENIPNTATYLSSGGEQYSDNNMLEINTPVNITKIIEVNPPKDKNGDLVDKVWCETDLGTFRYWSDLINEGIQRKKYSYNDKDEFILDQLIKNWITKTPVYNDKPYDLKLCSPNYQSCLLTEYQSPLKPLENTDKSTPAALANSIAASNVIAASNSIVKTKLSVVFPEEFEAKVREDVPSFKIYVGELPVEEEGSGFIFTDDFEPLEELSPEYLENQYQGEAEELIITEEEIDVEVLNDIKGFDPEKPNEALSTDTSSKYPLSKDKDANARSIIKAAKSSGVTNKYTISAILAIVSKESGFVPRSEASYSGTSAKRIKDIFKRFRKYSDSEVDVMKKNPVKFFDVIYGDKYGNAANEGYKYRGRGFNQITFKGNYKTYADETGLNLINDPDLLNTVDAAAKCLIAYFKRNIKKAPAGIKANYHFTDINSFKNLDDAVGAIYHANAGWGKSYSEVIADSTGGRKKAFSKAGPLYNTYQSSIT